MCQGLAALVCAGPWPQLLLLRQGFEGDVVLQRCAVGSSRGSLQQPAQQAMQQPRQEVQQATGRQAAWLGVSRSPNLTVVSGRGSYARSSA